MLLCHSPKKTQKYGDPFPLRQAVDGFPQRYFFYHPLLRAVCPQGGFQRQAVDGLLLEGFQRPVGQLYGGDLLHSHSRLLRQF